MKQSDEQWLPVIGHVGYEVSNMGRVRSFRTGKERILCLYAKVDRSTPNAPPYLRVYINGRGMCVGRLVAFHFIGPPPSSGHHAAHLNGIHQDNRADNLAWKTRHENMLDKVIHETWGRKFVSQDIRDIHHLRECGMNRRDIIARAGACTNVVADILLRKTWKHIS